MKRLLLIFIVIEHVISFIHALPHKEVNLEEFDKSKKNYSIIIFLEDVNSMEDVPKKSGRTIHQTAWSKENKNDELNIVEKDTAKTNSSKNVNSWDLSQLLKLILNLVHKKEEKTEQIYNSDKDNRVSKNKLLSGAQKSESSIGKKHNESPKEEEVESDSNFESNSYNNYPFNKPYEQKKKDSRTATDSSMNRIIEKTTKSKDIGADSPLKLRNEEFLKSERLIDEPTLQETKRSQLFEENYYYDDEDYEDEEDCESYSSSFSSNKAEISRLASKEITKDNNEAGGIEESDEDYLKLVSETAKELVSEIPITNVSYSPINQNELKIQEKFNDEILLSKEMSINTENDTKKETKKQYPISDVTSIQTQSEDTLKQNKSTNTEKPFTVNERTIVAQSQKQNVTLTTKDDQTVLQEPDFQNNNGYATISYRPLKKSFVLQEVTNQSLTSPQTHVQSTTPLTPDGFNYDSSEVQEVTGESLTSHQTHVQATTPITPDVVKYESSKLQDVTDQSLTSHQTRVQTTTPLIPGNDNYESSELQEVTDQSLTSIQTHVQSTSTIPVDDNYKISALQKATDQSLTSHQTHIKSTTPSIPNVANYPTKNAKFQPQMQDQLNQGTILQETSSKAETTQSDSFSEQTSFNEVFLTPKTPDTIPNRKPVKKAKNVSINNEEINQELLLSLPLSSSGEYISYISEKDQQLSITSEIDQQLSKVSKKVRQLSNTSGKGQQLSNTSEKNRQFSNTSEEDQQLSKTSESKPVKKDSQFQAENYSKDNLETNQELLFPLSSSGEFTSYISEKDRQLSNTSEKERQLPNTSERDRQVSNISESGRKLSNTSENDKKLILLETDSKSSNLEVPDSQKDLTENEKKKTNIENSGFSYISTSLTKEQKEIQSPLLQNMMIFENEKTHFSAEDGSKDLTSEDKSQIINNFAYQHDGLQKDSTDFNKNQVAIILNNKADENLNFNQNGDSLQINQVPDRISGISVTHDRASKNIEENESDNEYYEFNDGNSVNFIFENDQKPFDSVKTSPTIKESDQNNFTLPNEPEKPYDTILQFLYKHSNSSLIKSLKENY